MTGSEYKDEDDIKPETGDVLSIARDLTILFGEEVVEQARMLDVADLKITDEMTAAIGEGIRQLKYLKNDPQAQRQWLAEQQPGLRLLLCLWIMDMELLEKIRTHPYI